MKYLLFEMSAIEAIINNTLLQSFDFSEGKRFLEILYGEYSPDSFESMHIEYDQKKEGLYIKLALRIQADKIYIEINNNSKLTVFEKERIQQKLDSVQQYKNMDEVLTNVLDQSEGAGLGIIIIILMLQKVGLSKDNYQVISDEDETITRIILPCNKTVFAGVEMISYEFINLEDNIPILKSSFEEAEKVVNTDGPIDRNALYKVIRKKRIKNALALQRDLRFFLIMI